MTRWWKCIASRDLILIASQILYSNIVNGFSLSLATTRKKARYMNNTQHTNNTYKSHLDYLSLNTLRKFR